MWIILYKDWEREISRKFVYINEKLIKSQDTPPDVTMTNKTKRHAKINMRNKQNKLFSNMVVC